MNDAAEVFGRIVSELEGRHRSDTEYRCRCPCPDHEDKNPSCDIKLVGDKILVKCRSRGCSQEAIIDALRDRNLWTTPTTHSKTTPHRTKPPRQMPKKKLPPGIPRIRKIENRKTGEVLDTKFFKDIWTYKDEHDKVIGYAVRFEDKLKKDVIPYFHKNQQGNWYEGFPKTPRPLYGLNLLSKASINLTIWIVEGEKCAEALQYLPQGLRRLAITSMGGTNAAKFTDWSPLAGRKIRIWPDNDKPGKKYTDEVRTQLEGLKPPPVIEVVDVARLGLHEKGDVYDWLQDHEPDELNRIPLTGKISESVKEEQEPDFEILPLPEIDIARIHGFASKFVELASRDSEADPAAILLTFLVRFGVEIGRNPYFYIGDTVHREQLAAVIVGNSALSRKGTSGKPIHKLFDYESLYGPDTLSFRPARKSSGPFSSGEGIIYAVRDQVEIWEKKGKAEGKMVISDPGVKDKRLFVLDEEFAGVLANTKREGNTLSTVIRTIWDTGNFDPLTKNQKMRATGAHIGWVSHITGHELTEKMSRCEGFSGFANRILWVFASRRGSIPSPRPMPEEELKKLKEKLVNILSFCRDLSDKSEIVLSSGAQKTWDERYYEKLMELHPGFMGVIAARGPAQVRRLAMLFALLDKEIIISTSHLNQAMAVWEYTVESSRYIFGGTHKNTNQEKLSQALEEKGEMTKSEISNLFSRHLSAEKMEKLIFEMVSQKIVKIEKRKTTACKPTTLVVWAKRDSKDK